MKLTTNFALAVRPGYTYLNEPVDLRPAKTRFYSMRTTFDMVVTRVTKLGTAVSEPTQKFDKELDFWHAMDGQTPWAGPLLRESDMLSRRGMYARKVLMQSMDPRSFELLEEKFEKTILTMHGHLVAALNGAVTNKAPLRTMRVRKTKTVSTFDVVANLRLPGQPKPIRVTAQFFPSPYLEESWLMHVRIPSPNDEFTSNLQHRLVAAETLIQDHMGIKIENVINGTQLDL